MTNRVKAALSNKGRRGEHWKEFSGKSVKITDVTVISIPAPFSVTCTARDSGYRFDIHLSTCLPIYGLKSTNHSPLAWPFELVAHFHGGDVKQTPVCIGCGLVLHRLWSNSTSKDDVERWMSKDSRYARNTENSKSKSMSLHPVRKVANG